MPKQLMTFLGKGNYCEITYQLPDGRRYTTRLFPCSLIEWFRPDRVTVFLTSAVMEDKNWAEFKAYLDDHAVNYTPVNIPIGSNENELWTIFDALIHNVESDYEIIFDVTHSFRSIPILSLLAMGYLSAIKGIEKIRLLYGAFEARNNDTAPVFDLTPFASLILWMIAAGQFIQTGNSRMLTDLIRHRISEVFQNPLPDTPKPVSLSRLQNNLSQLTLALFMNRALDITHYAELVTQSLEEVKNDVDQFIKPLSTLLDPMKESFEPLSNPTLRSHLKIIEWFIEREHIYQAVLFMREFLVTLVSIRLDCDILDERYIAEDVLNLSTTPETRVIEDEHVYDRLRTFESFDDYETIRNLWNRLRDLRNDLAHCGYRSNRKTIQSIKDRTKNCFDVLKSLNIPDVPLPDIS